MKLFFYIITFLFTDPGWSGEVAFQKKKIILNGFDRPTVVQVELAETDDQRAQGLMFRKSLKKDSGMLFVFDKPQVLGFWMKNTRMSLAIGFFDESKCLFEVQEMTAPSNSKAELRSYESKQKGLYALEMESGWFHKKFSEAEILSGKICFQFQNQKRTSKI